MVTFSVTYKKSAPIQKNMKDPSKAKYIYGKDGVKVYYWMDYDTQRKNKWTIFHPGSSMNHSSLEAIEHEFNKKGHSTINIDPRGAGLSDKPIQKVFYTLDKFTDDLYRIIQKEGLEKPTVLGHSMGFPVAVNYASENPIDTIIGICGPYNLKNNSANKKVTKILDKKAIRILTGKLGSLIAQSSRIYTGEKRMYPDYAQTEGKSDFDVWLRIFDVDSEQQKAYIASGQKIITWNVETQLKKISNHTILIYGNKDLFVVPETAYEIKRLLKGPFHIHILSGTHTLPTTEPIRVMNVLKNYI